MKGPRTDEERNDMRGPKTEKERKGNPGRYGTESFLKTFGLGATEF